MMTTVISLFLSFWAWRRGGGHDGGNALLLYLLVLNRFVLSLPPPDEQATRAQRRLLRAWRYGCISVVIFARGKHCTPVARTCARRLFFA